MNIDQLIIRTAHIHFYIGFINFYRTDNPWACICELEWLIRMVQSGYYNDQLWCRLQDTNQLYRNISMRNVSIENFSCSIQGKFKNFYPLARKWIIRICDTVNASRHQSYQIYSYNLG